MLLSLFLNIKAIVDINFDEWRLESLLYSKVVEYIGDIYDNGC